MLIHDGVSMSPIKQLDALLRSSLILGLCSSLHWDTNKNKQKNLLGLVASDYNIYLTNDIQLGREIGFVSLIRGVMCLFVF